MSLNRNQSQSFLSNRPENALNLDFADEKNYGNEATRIRFSTVPKTLNTIKELTDVRQAIELTLASAKKRQYNENLAILTNIGLCGIPIMLAMLLVHQYGTVSIHKYLVLLEEYYNPGFSSRVREKWCN